MTAKIVAYLEPPADDDYRNESLRASEHAQEERCVRLLVILIAVHVRKSR